MNDIDQLLSRKESLERTRADLQAQQGAVLADLGALADDRGSLGPLGTAELLELEGRAGTLTDAVARLDRALDDVGAQLRTAQAAADRAGVVDAIVVATEAALEATAAEQEEYDRLFVELGAVLTKISVARDDGARARSHLRGLIKAESSAFAALGYWTVTTPRQEAAAVRLEKELEERAVDVRPALDARADLPFARLIAPLLEAYLREAPHTPLEAA